MELGVVIIIMLSLNFSVVDNAVRVTRMEGQCKEYTDFKAHVTIKFYEKDGSTFVNQTLNVTKPFSSFGKLVIIAKRCPTRENLNYCENLRNVTIPHMGLLMGNAHSPWSKGFTYIPPFGKPVEPGVYHLNKKKLDNSWYIISSKGYWRNKAVMMEEGTDDVIFCIYAEGEIR